MLPDKLKTKSLKAYHFLDKKCNWAYVRYVTVEEVKSADARIFIYHSKCDNKNNVEYPRALYNSLKKELFCSGCDVIISEDIEKGAKGIWMLEKTNYVR